MTAMNKKYPPDLGPRGIRLYESLVGATSPEAEKVLAEEAARTADRLDELDSIIAGKGVLKLMQFRLHESFDADDDRHLTITVKFDSVLSEARGQQSTLKGLLVTLGVEKGLAAPAPAPKKKGTGLDELKQRRAERQTSGTAGS